MSAPVYFVLPTTLRRRWTSLLAVFALLLSVTVVFTAVATAVATKASADTAPAAGLPATVAADALPTVQIDGVVWSQVTVGNTVYATGSFGYARPAGTPVGDPSSVVRSNLLAYDITTGNLITSFNHSLNAQGLAITASPDGSTIYVGGDFTVVDGVTRQHIAAFSTSTGALLTNFHPTFASQVRAIAATNSTVYVGGNFLSVNGNAVNRLAAVTASTGASLSWTPSADNLISALLVSPDGSKVIIAGKFTTLNGLGERGIGAVDATTGASATWNANFPVWDDGDQAGFTTLTTDGTNLYGGAYNYGSKNGGGNFEGRFASDFAGNVIWLDSCHGDTYSVFVQGQVLYETGHSHDCSDTGNWEDTNPRTWHRALAETLTPSGGTLAHNNNSGYADFYGQPDNTLLDWFPAVSLGSYTGQEQGGWSMTGNSQYLSMGGEFPKVNNVAQQGLVRFAVRTVAPNKMGPYATANMTPTAVSFTAGSARVTWGATWDPDNANLTYKVYRDTSTTPVYTVSANSNFWTLPNFTFNDTGLVAGSTHTYKVKAFDSYNNPISSPGTASVTIAASGSTNSSAYSKAVLNAGATDYWRLGETSGSKAYDLAGASDLTEGTGVVQNAAGAISGDSDAATSFNGSSTGTAGSPALTQLTSKSISVQAWAKIPSSGFTPGKIIGLGNAASGASTYSDDNLYIDSSGHVVFSVTWNGYATAMISPVTYNDNAWHQFTGSVGPDGMSLYVDGKRINRQQSVNVTTPESGYWRVGGDSTVNLPDRPSSDYLNATIDEAAVYPTALTLAQVQQQYTASGRSLNLPATPTDSYGAAVAAANPDLYWRLDDATGSSTAADAGTNGSAGIYAGGVTNQVASTVTGTNGTGVTFNGTTGTIGSQPVGNPIVYSEQLWFKTTTTSGGKLIGFGDSQTGQSGVYDRQVYMLNSGQLSFGTYNGSLNVATSPASYNDGQWHEVVATQGPNGMTLYVDGAVVATNAANTAYAYDGYWRVGGDSVANWPSQPSSAYFAGTIDEVAVYPTALSAAQVVSQYRSSPAASNQKPVAAFSSSCPALYCSFDGSASSDPDGSVASWSWNFGDGSTGTGATVGHSYAAAGTYTVTLTVTDNRGAQTSVSHTVTTVAAANKAPVASFTQSCTAYACSFNGTKSTDSDGTVTAWSWNFGDGTTGTGSTATHTYAVAGDYTVTLTVTDNSSATTSTSQTVSPVPPANPDTSKFAADKFNRTTTTGWGSADTGGAWTTSGTTAVAPGTASMSLNAGGSASAYLGSTMRTDADVTTTVTTSVAPTGGGQYVYVVGRRVGSNSEYRADLHLLSTGKVGIAFGKLDGSATETVLKSETAIAGLTYAAGTKLDMRFQVTGTNPTTLRVKVWVDGTTEPTAWTASITDSSSALQNPGAVGIRSYASGSTTNGPVKTQVTAFSAGPTNTPPTAAFTASCSARTCAVNASSSTDPQGNIASYAWSFGDGATATGSTASHAFSAAGSYRITLTVTDGAGLTSVSRTSVTVS